MNGLDKATKKDTWLKIFLVILTKEEKPLNKGGFRKELKKLRLKCDDNKLGVLLNFVARKGAIVQVKYPGCYPYYGLPEWIDPKTKFFKRELKFDKFRGEFKNKPK